MTIHSQISYKSVLAHFITASCMISTVALSLLALPKIHQGGSLSASTWCSLNSVIDLCGSYQSQTVTVCCCWYWTCKYTTFRLSSTIVVITSVSFCCLWGVRFFFLLFLWHFLDVNYAGDQISWMCTSLWSGVFISLKRAIMSHLCSWESFMNQTWNNTPLMSLREESKTMSELLSQEVHWLFFILYNMCVIPRGHVYWMHWVAIRGCWGGWGGVGDLSRWAGGSTSERHTESDRCSCVVLIGPVEQAVWPALVLQGCHLLHVCPSLQQKYSLYGPTASPTRLPARMLAYLLCFVF